MGAGFSGSLSKVKILVERKPIAKAAMSNIHIHLFKVI